MIRAFALLLFLFCFLAGGAAEAARRVTADVSEDFVAVSETFSGARLTVFGIVKSGGDVAIVIEGPPAEAKIRQKKRQMGLWINGEAEVLSPVPGFYAVLSSRPLTEMISGGMAQKYGLGLSALPFAGAPGGAGLIAVKKNQGLYLEDPEGVSIRESKLFRANVELPANVPIGAYQAHIYEFMNGLFVSSRTEAIAVAQVGLAAFLKNAARTRPYLYALAALSLSLTIGGGAAYALRRRS